MIRLSAKWHPLYLKDFQHSEYFYSLPTLKLLLFYLLPVFVCAGDWGSFCNILSLLVSRDFQVDFTAALPAIHRCLQTTYFMKSTDVRKGYCWPK